MDFSEAVFIGDTITATGTVSSWRASRSMGEMEFEVVTQDGDMALKGTAMVYRAVPTS